MTSGDEEDVLDFTRTHIHTHTHVHVGITADIRINIAHEITFFLFFSVFLSWL